MKKCFYVMGIICLFLLACNRNGNQTVVKEESKPAIFTIDQVNESWQTATINGVENADVMDMVVAFQKQWPTQSVAALLEELKLPEEEQQYLSMFDKENAFMSFAEGSDDADSESMEAHVWQRSNGHQLFGITFFQPSSAVKSFAAFYDYDSAQKKLVPETSLSNLFTPSFFNEEFAYHFPEEGNGLMVNEYFFNWQMALHHVYDWDGMAPFNPSTQMEDIADVMDEFDRNYMTYEMGEISKYALIDIDEDGEPEMILSTDDEEYQMVLSIVEGKATMIAGKDFKRHLIFYKGVIGDAGGCGTGCFYAHYTKLKDSASEFTLGIMQSYNFETDDMDYEYYKGEELLTEEEGQAILDSFGEVLEDPVLEWRPLWLGEDEEF